MKLAVLCSHVRIEEKLIFRALEKRGVDYDRLDERQLEFDLVAGGDKDRYDVVWCRSISHTRALYALSMFSTWHIPSVNSYEVVKTCGDKVLTTLAFAQHGLPTLNTSVALGVESALQTMERMGYPVVLKPVIGSWGRLLSKINDRETAEAVLRHRAGLGGPAHKVFYIQEYVDKGGRDIRTMVIGEEVVYATYRRSEHWITNTARGGQSLPCPLTPEIRDLSLAAARAVGGGILAVDLLETPEGRLLVNEVNDTPEFHGAARAVDVDIAGSMADHVLEQAQVGRR